MSRLRSLGVAGFALFAIGTVRVVDARPKKVQWEPAADPVVRLLEDHLAAVTWDQRLRAAMMGAGFDGGCEAWEGPASAMLRAGRVAAAVESAQAVQDAYWCFVGPSCAPLDRRPSWPSIPTSGPSASGSPAWRVCRTATALWTTSRCSTPGRRPTNYSYGADVHPTPIRQVLVALAGLCLLSVVAFRAEASRSSGTSASTRRAASSDTRTANQSTATVGAVRASRF